MRKNMVVLLLVTLILAMALPLAVRFYQNEEAFSPYNLIRVHIVANSDSTFDQQVKLAVRDRIVAHLTPQLLGVKTIEQSRAIIYANLEALREEATRELQNHNCDYGVKVALGEFQFPTKSYGDLTLPQGEYQALKIVLGEGRGKNWWCVLFPPLCFQEGRDHTLVYQGEKPPFFLKQRFFLPLNHNAWNGARVQPIVE